MPATITTEPYGRNKQINITYAGSEIMFHYQREYCVVVDDIAYTKLGDIYTVSLEDYKDIEIEISGGVKITAQEIITGIDVYASNAGITGITTTFICSCPKFATYRMHITRVDGEEYHSGTDELNVIASVPVDVNGRTLYIGQIGEALSNLGDLIDPNK